MDSSRQLKLGALLSYVSIGINIITGFLFTPWMISSIGKENFGLYTLAMSVISLFVFDFGLSSAVTRFIAKYLAEDKQEKANQFLGLVGRLYLVIDIMFFFVLIGVFFFIPNIYKELTLNEIEKFKIIYAKSAIYSVFSFPFIPLNGVLTAHEKFVELRICEIIQKFIIISSMGFCLFWGYGLYALVLANAIAGFIMIGMKLWIILKKTSQGADISYFNKAEFREIFGYSGWVTIIALAQRCIFNLAPTILGALSGSTAIAILGIATTLEGYTFTFASALNGMFLPKVSRIVADKDGDVLPLMVRVGRFQIYIIGLIVLGVVFWGRDFIRLWVGEAFDESYLCAVFIILPSLFYLPQDIGIQTIYAKNKVKKLMYVYIFMALFNLAGAFILAPKFGTVGVCVSIGCAYILRTVGMDIIFKNDLGIDIWSFFKRTYLNLLPSFIVVIMISFVSNILINGETLVGFMLEVLIFIIVYGVIMMISMNRDERKLILSPVMAIIRK